MSVGMLRYRGWVIKLDKDVVSCCLKTPNITVIQHKMCATGGKALVGQVL